MIKANFIGKCDAKLTFEYSDGYNSTPNIYMLSTLLSRVLGHRDLVELVKNLEFQLSSASVYSELSEATNEERPIIVLYEDFHHIKFLGLGNMDPNLDQGPDDQMIRGQGPSGPIIHEIDSSEIDSSEIDPEE